MILALKDLSEAQGWALIIAAIATALSGIIGAVAAAVGAVRSKTNSSKLDAVKVQGEKQVVKVAEIHELTNSNLTKVKQELTDLKKAFSVLQKENKNLEEDKPTNPKR